MEVTRQLLTEWAGKTGLSRIQLTFGWDSQRLRLGSGQKCHPKNSAIAKQAAAIQ